MKKRFSTSLLTVILSAMMIVAIGCSDDDDPIMGVTTNMGSGADRPALQGALLGALVSRTH